MKKLSTTSLGGLSGLLRGEAYALRFGSGGRGRGIVEVVEERGSPGGIEGGGGGGGTLARFFEFFFVFDFDFEHTWFPPQHLPDLRDGNGCYGGEEAPFMGVLGTRPDYPKFKVFI